MHYILTINFNYIGYKNLVTKLQDLYRIYKADIQALHI